ncbi:hypothetical protein Tco_1165679 [Tanacetum coccineum]
MGKVVVVRGWAATAVGGASVGRDVEVMVAAGGEWCGSGFGDDDDGGVGGGGRGDDDGGDEVAAGEVVMEMWCGSGGGWPESGRKRGTRGGRTKNGLPRIKGTLISSGISRIIKSMGKVKRGITLMLAPRSTRAIVKAYIINKARFPLLLHSNDYHIDLEKEPSFVLTCTPAYCSVQWIRRIGEIQYGVSGVNQLQ